MRTPPRCAAPNPGRPEGRPHPGDHHDLHAPLDAFAKQRPATSQQSSDKLAPDCSGLDFFEIDQSLPQLLPLYVPQAELQYFLPHFKRLGQLAGGRLNELATVADKHGPVLHTRSRWGEDEDWVEYHPAYQEMERIAFEQFQFHAMTHRPGAMGYSDTLSPITKYVFQYLFVQSEFGQMCPISVTDTSIHLIRKFGSDELKAQAAAAHAGRQAGGLVEEHPVHDGKGWGIGRGQVETTARLIDGQWHLFGEKWFSSHVDADLALILARPEDAPAGTRGLALFAMPRYREDGSRNSYRIVRLKDKLGTRSMASGGCLRIEGAFAYLVGDPPRACEADDGAGRPVAPVARGARGRHDAPLPQRVLAGHAPPPGLRPSRDRLP